MIDRRELLVGAATLAGAGLPVPVAAAELALSGLNWAAFDGKPLKLLAKAPRIALVGYRFGMVVRSGISASTMGNRAMAQADVELAGVGVDDLRAIAAVARDDFLTQLAATGRPLVPVDEMRASRGWGELERTPVPFAKSPFADARLAVFTAPPGEDLVFTHFDAPMSAQGPLSLGNWRALNQMSVDLKAVLLLPTLVLDFAQLSGSGQSSLGGGASVSARPGLFIPPMLTYLAGFHAKIRIAGDLGRANLKSPVLIGQAGDFVKTADANNRAEVANWNAMAAMNTARGSGPDAYSRTSYQYRVDGPLFAQRCAEAAKAANAAFAEAVRANPA